ncbi:MAG: hypothetical protein HY854_05560 [Burkholderiales bacterium]|nr:hypothetical protein [Burkholderiales bacterium]
MRALLALIWLLAHGYALATAQIPDSIVVDGQDSQMFSEPLFPYLRDNKESSWP